MALVWGVHPVLIQETSGTDELFASPFAALACGYIENGDLVV